MNSKKPETTAQVAEETTPAVQETTPAVPEAPKAFSFKGFTMPTVEDIVKRYSDYNPALDTEAAYEAEKASLMKLTKEVLVEKLLENKKEARTDTVQDLAKAILSDEDLIASNYEDIAEAIRTLKPGSKTSSKSIASYVSKKREEWNLPQRIRISRS